MMPFNTLVQDVLMLRTWILLLLISSVLSCSSNLLEDSANTETTEAQLFQARLHLNDQEWAEAIAVINSLDASVIATREAQDILVSAYAGLCGIEFIAFVDTISNATGLLYPLLQQSFLNSTPATISNCVNSEFQLKNIDSSLGSTSTNYLKSIIVALAKIGNILNANADQDNDGVTDVGFDACDTADISDADVNELVTAVAIIATNTANAGSSALSDYTSDITDLCTEIEAVIGVNICSVTDTANVTPAMRTGMRNVIQEGQSVGLGTCTAVPNSLALCSVPPFGC